MLERGRVLGDRYEIIEEIGSGGMAVVYKAQDYKLRRLVAIKVLKREYTEDEMVLGKFRKEALSAGSLTHPNIVAVYDLGHEDDMDYIVMEYIDGITLKEYIQRRDMLSSEEVVKISIKIAEALKSAHANGIIHRDIKPQNIMVTPQGDVKVTDFGIAKATTSTTVTQQGEALGSVHYFSPEQARGSFVDSRSDLYSLGITMYEMATKKLPFTADTPVAVAMKHLHEALPDPGELAPQLWPGLIDIIVKLTQKRPEQRYQTADELIQDLKFIYKDHRYRVSPRKAEPVAASEYTATRPPVKTRAQQERERQQLMAQREERRRQQKKRQGMIISLSVLGVVLLVLLVVIFRFALAGGSSSQNSEISQMSNGSSSVANQESPTAAESQAQSQQVAETSEAEQVLMPQVSGLSYEEARSRLNQAQISFTVQEAYDDQVEVGYVISQQPGEGAAITDSTSVVLVVSLGPEQTYVPVPNVTNMSREEAAQRLQEAGLSIGNESEEHSSTYPEGYVINQSPSGDTEVPAGSAVDITVSLGPAESSSSQSGGTITIMQPFAASGDSGHLVVQAYDAQNQSSTIYDSEVTYDFIQLLGGSLKVNYPAGTTRIEVYMNDTLIMSETVQNG